MQNREIRISIKDTQIVKPKNINPINKFIYNSFTRDNVMTIILKSTNANSGLMLIPFILVSLAQQCDKVNGYLTCSLFLSIQQNNRCGVSLPALALFASSVNLVTPNSRTILA